jgi:hypothetical protein
MYDQKRKKQNAQNQIIVPTTNRIRFNFEMNKIIREIRKGILIIFLLAYGLIFCCYVFIGCSSEKVLPKIETYHAPPFPENEYKYFKMKKEPYDYLIKQGSAVPQSLTNVFICDIRLTMETLYSINVSNVENISEDDVMKALRFYLSNDWILIPGYRPWTHWNFVHRLKKGEIETLAKEIVEHMKSNGAQLNCNL